MEYQISVGGGDTGQPINLAKRLAIIKEIGLDNKTILDCGCGAGEYVRELMKEKNVNVWGIEFSTEKVNLYKSQFPSLSNVFQGDIENMPFESENFDLVILNEVLEHIPSQVAGLREIYRVLKPFGKLIVFSPNRLYPFETHGILSKKSDNIISKSVPFIPYLPIRLGAKLFRYRARNYFPMELRRILKKQNFRIERHFYITQTFEGIGGGIGAPAPMKNFLRNVFSILEKIPVLRAPFSVSQVLVVEKSGDL
jgi:ubiquinone/menaquinone biosynthesis C-methylase UbiE